MTNLQGTWTSGAIQLDDAPPGTQVIAAPEATLLPGPDGVVDFTEAHPPVRFRIDADIFTVIPGLPALAMLRFAQLANRQQEDSNDPEAMRDIFEQMFRLILTADCADTFLSRMSDDELSKPEPHPITIWQVQRITPWVLEQLGLRPIEPSDSSSDGSFNPESGLNSTASAPPPGSTSAVYPFPSSSTSAIGS
jgi:hypothetical protein